MFNAILLPLELFKFECHQFMTSTKNDKFCDKFQDPMPPPPFLWGRHKSLGHTIITSSCSHFGNLILRTFKTLHQPLPTLYKSSKLCDL